MFSVENNDRKERKKEGKNIFKTNALVPKKAVLRKEEGATAPTFSQRAASFVGPSGSKQRQIQTIGKDS